MMDSMSREILKIMLLFLLLPYPALMAPGGYGIGLVDENNRSEREHMLIPLWVWTIGKA
jgi:hypothetical protein